jgi:hypothetical protein
MHYLLLLGMLVTEDLYDGPIPDPRITIIIGVCSKTAHAHNILFKAENNVRRFIVRSVHCHTT